jgi:hypothetical protein
MEDFKLIGIDSTLIDRIYFHSQADKTEYLEKIDSILKRLEVKIGDPRLDVIKKIADGNIPLQFLNETLAYSGGLQYSKNTDRNNYYTNCKLCEYNIAAKVAARVYDFQPEEILFKSILSIDLNGYAKANLIFTMGKEFSKLDLWEKADSYFEIFRQTTFELSPVTVSDFYRRIAEIYLEAGKKEASLYWLKEGLGINPKLGVKKLIKTLETK